MSLIITSPFSISTPPVLPTGGNDGIIMGGDDIGVPDVSVTDTKHHITKYDNTTHVLSPSATTLAAVNSAPRCHGNTANGYSSGGTSIASTNKYTYVSDSCVIGTSLPWASWQAAVGNNDEAGYGFGGLYPSGRITGTWSYTYAGDTTANAGTSLAFGVNGHSAFNSQLAAYIGPGDTNGGDPTNALFQKYTFATNTMNTSFSSTPVAMSDSTGGDYSAGSNTIKGVVIRGVGYQFSFASETWSSFSVGGANVSREQISHPSSFSYVNQTMSFPNELATVMSTLNNQSDTVSRVARFDLTTDSYVASSAHWAAQLRYTGATSNGHGGLS